MPMSNLREAVARAIHADHTQDAPMLPDWDQLSQFDQSIRRSQADAAIAAVLEHLIAAAERTATSEPPYHRASWRVRADWLRSFREAGQ